eukprot:11318436-Karenia_brevis.AAC.1
MADAEGRVARREDIMKGKVCTRFRASQARWSESHRAQGGSMETHTTQPRRRGRARREEEKKEK